jgi:phospholipase/lecithinase/hemolysin
MFDLNALMTKIVANQTIAFSNTVDRCWDALNLTTVAILCQDPSKYVFIDSLHLTSTVHQLIADAVSPFLSYNQCSKKIASLGILLLSLLTLIF